MPNETENRDSELDAVEAKIIRERDELLVERSHLMNARMELLIRLRNADRRLADCRAAARFFGLKIDFPEVEPEQMDRIEHERVQRERAIRIAEREATMRRAEIVRAEHERAQSQRELPFNKTKLATAVLSAGSIVSTNSSATLSIHPGAPSSKDLKSPTAIDSDGTPPKTVREVILERLEVAGKSGSKASAIREFYERTFGRPIHEKTIGMTLYRLQLDGLVRHEGHTWFLAPPKAETGNPGGETPGPFNQQT
jgi:hypothetical protein